MPKRLTVEVINNRINKEDYTCTSYNITTKKFEYTCPQGHKGSMRMDHWGRGVRCSTCSGNKKLTFKDVYTDIISEGYTLLDTDYTNSKTIMSLVCPNGHTYKVSWNNWSSGYRCSKCTVNKLTGINNPYIKSGAYSRYKSEDHYNYKGGVSKKGVPLYATYAIQLKKYHKVYSINKDGLSLLGTNCLYCNKIFIPKLHNVVNRLRVINGKKGGKGESNFYCSGNCKKACPTFGQKLYPKGFKPATSREVQPQLRKLVLKRDNYKCQICESTIEETQLHCHHLTTVTRNPIESADVDNCITLCKKHHKQVHKLPDCGYHELKCANIKEITQLSSFISSIYTGIILEGSSSVLENAKKDILTLPESKLIIKYCTLHDNSELAGSKRISHLHDLEVCEEKGYRLITIFEDEWLLSTEKCKSRLASYINSKNMRRIFARKCTIMEITPSEAKKFCEYNHLQNYGSGSSIKLGLFLQDELVSVMTFSKPSLSKGRKKSTNIEYELHRFCSKLFTLVIGGASKLLKYFERNYYCDLLFTFADKRWSNANLYYWLGFEKESSSLPCYYYFNENKVRRHRFLYRKNVLRSKLSTFDPTKTEVQNMYDNGYDRIWDCGNYKLSKSYNNFLIN